MNKELVVQRVTMRQKEARSNIDFMIKQLDDSCDLEYLDHLVKDLTESLTDYDFYTTILRCIDGQAR